MTVSTFCVCERRVDIKNSAALRESLLHTFLSQAPERRRIFNVHAALADAKRRYGHSSTRRHTTVHTAKFDAFVPKKYSVNALGEVKML